MQITGRKPQPYTWRDVANRLRSIGSKVPSGAAAIVIRVLILDGDPVQWQEPEAYRLEPKRAAQQFIDWLNTSPDSKQPPRIDLDDPDN